MNKIHSDDLNDREQPSDSNNLEANDNLDISQFHRVDINLYPLFIAIYEQKSISKAALILCISQSAVSHALQRLRQQLGDELFIRAGHKMLATPFAEQIYTPIKQALLTIQSIATSQNTFNPKAIHSLKIAVHDEIEPIIFPKLLAHFQSLDLNIQFLSAKLDRKTMFSDLSIQQADFVIDLKQHCPSNIHYQSLIEDHFVVCSQQENVNKTIYLDAPHIGVSSRRTGQLVEDIDLNRQQLSRQILLRCQHYSTALQVLAQHPEAMLTIPKLILQNLHYAHSIHVHELPIALPKIDIGMYWYQDLAHNPRHQFLRTEILKLAQLI